MMEGDTCEVVVRSRSRSCSAAETGPAEGICNTHGVAEIWVLELKQAGCVISDRLVRSVERFFLCLIVVRVKVILDNRSSLRCTSCFLRLRLVGLTLRRASLGIGDLGRRLVVIWVVGSLLLALGSGSFGDSRLLAFKGRATLEAAYSLVVLMASLSWD